MRTIITLVVLAVRALSTNVRSETLPGHANYDRELKETSFQPGKGERGVDNFLPEKDAGASRRNVENAAALAEGFVKRLRRVRRLTLSDESTDVSDANGYYCAWCNPSVNAKRSRPHVGENIAIDQTKGVQRAARKRSPFILRRLRGYFRRRSAASRNGTIWRKRSPRPDGWFSGIAHKVSDFCIKHSTLCSTALSWVGK